MVSKLGGGQVAVSFSGGKDSTVLLDLVRKIYPDVVAVFSDTGLEFPEIKDFVKRFDNIQIVKPDLVFTEVISKFGYPIISKQYSRMIWDLQHPTPNNEQTRKLRLTGITRNGTKAPTMKLPNKWQYLADADFEIGDNCCNKMKKEPLKHYYHQTGLHPMTAVMTCESERREKQWLLQGCNAFDLKEPISTPLAFWTEQDVLRYIYINNLPYASVYGELKENENGELYFTEYKRTGCCFCGFGCHLEKEPNRFQVMAKTHPKLYDYCMRGGKYDERGKWVPDKGLGMAKVLDTINVKWWNREEEKEKYCYYNQINT